MLLLLQCLRPLAQVDTVCWAHSVGRDWLTAVATNWPLTCSVALALVKSGTAKTKRQAIGHPMLLTACLLRSAGALFFLFFFLGWDFVVIAIQHLPGKSNQLEVLVHLCTSTWRAVCCPIVLLVFAWSVYFLFLVMICVDRVSYDFFVFLLPKFCLIMSLLDCYSCHCWAHCIIYLL